MNLNFPLIFSRRQPSYLPSITGLLILEPVVQAVFPALPEFGAFWDDAVSAPEVGQGDVAVAEFALHRFEGLFQQGA